MKIIVYCVIGCFFLFAGLGCERTDKAFETYKKVKEDAQKTLEKKAQDVLGTQDKRLKEQQQQEKDK